MLKNPTKIDDVLGDSLHITWAELRVFCHTYSMCEQMNKFLLCSISSVFCWIYFVLYRWIQSVLLHWNEGSAKLSQSMQWSYSRSQNATDKNGRLYSLFLYLFFSSWTGLVGSLATERCSCWFKFTQKRLEITCKWFIAFISAANIFSWNNLFLLLLQFGHACYYAFLYMM